MDKIYTSNFVIQEGVDGTQPTWEAIDRILHKIVDIVEQEHLSIGGGFLESEE